MPGAKRFFYKKGSKKKEETKKQRAIELEEPELADDNTDSEGEEERTHKKVRWEINDNDEAEYGELDSGELRRRDAEETAMSSEKIVLALYSQHFRVGCAHYDPMKMTMYVLEDSVESSHYDLTKLLLEQVCPDIVITSTRADEGSIDAMREFADGSESTFLIRPAREFTPAKGRDRLLSLSLLSELPIDEAVASSSTLSSSDPPANAYDFMRKRREVHGDPSMKRWNASIRVGNFASLEGSSLCLSSIGALLDHLAKVRVMADLENEGVSGLDIRAIEYIRLEQFMQINVDALSSLQIFESESHASVHSDKTKEGLSLFGILNTTRTTLGRILLRQWLLRPSLSLPVINARHDVVDCLVQPENVPTADAMSTHLKGLRNIPRILKLLKTGKAGRYEWEGIVKFAFHASLLREALTELNCAGEVEIFKNLVNTLDVTSFREVGNAIHETIDWEESVHAGRVCVRPNIDEELDKWKHVYNGIDGVLSRVSDQISETVPPDYTSTLNVVYFPQLGFLICIPMKESWTTEAGIDVLDGWTFQFNSETYVYFKSGEMRDMDKHIGDLLPLIVDREIEIIQALLDKALQYADAIAKACDACAELDCLLCFADASRMYNYRRPSMTEKNITLIVQGRHPLQEQVVDTFVPNDTHMKGGVGNNKDNLEEDHSNESAALKDARSVLVLTGANACGKSVYLKQTALIQYMAQIGCFVPAEAATLGIVDKIFTRVQTRETVSKMQSAFMIDLNQVSLALRNSTARSLILLDEFGKGTLSSDGAGLLCGVLRSFLARGSECPKVLVATHFHEIFRADLLDPELPISFLHMQILLPDFPDEDDSALEYDTDADLTLDEDDTGTRSHRRLRNGETITYLYRVASGLYLESHAARCAQMFGLPRSVARRAQYVTSMVSTYNITRLLDEEMTPAEAQDLVQAEEVCRRFMAWDLTEAAKDVGFVGTGAVKAKLNEVLGRDADKDDNDGSAEAGGAQEIDGML